MKKIFAVLASAKFGISLTKTGLLVLFLPYFSLSQIKIDERVEINSSTAKNNLNMNASAIYTDSGFIMWKSGYLQVDYNSHYSYLYHVDGPMPDYSSLNTYFLKDSSFKIDSLLPKFPQLTVGTFNFYDYCNSSYVQRTRYFYKRETPGLYNLGYVEEGDTVRFSYYSDIVGSGTPYTYEITDAYEIDEGWVFDVYQIDTCFQMGVNDLSILVNIDNGYELVVSIEPEVLGADDTANVVIQYRDIDGTLYDFPPEQTFELAVLDGCVNGNFMVGDSIDVYFADALQPIKFVTADVLDSEVGEVLIRVGTDLSGYNGYNRPVGGESGEEQKLAEYENKQIGATGKTLKELRAGFEKMIAERKAEAEKKEGNTLSRPDGRGTEPPIEAPIVTACTPDNPSYEFNTYKNVVVGDECENAPDCNIVLLKPSFTFETFPNGSFNNDVCTIEQKKVQLPKVASGVFSFMPWLTNSLDYFNINNITYCYDQNFDVWRFGHSLPLYPYFRAIKDVCVTNITNGGYRPLIQIGDIIDPTKWNDTKLCDAKQDLEGHRSYPSKVRHPDGYVFLEVEMAHESAHGQDFQLVIDSLQSAFLYPTLNSFKLSCSDVINEEDAKSAYFFYLQKVIVGQTVNGKRVYEGFEQKLDEGYKNHIKGSYTINGNIVDHETYINNFPIVTNTINVLLSDFEIIWGCK